MIGELIAELRKDSCLTQSEVANYLGTSTGTISNYERGRYEPDLKTIRHLCTLFNVSSDYLIGLSKEKYGPLQISKKFGQNSSLESCLLTLQKLDYDDQCAMERVFAAFRTKYDRAGGNL